MADEKQLARLRKSVAGWNRWREKNQGVRPNLSGAVVSDATAGAIVEEGNGYEAALVNFRFLASAVWTTDEAVQAITESAPALR